MKVVIVESPSKAKTINKYLGAGYEVTASFGHIRDLPSKNGSVRPEEGFAMTWNVDERSERHIKDIARLAAKADEILLATDPDREGEAISWHVLEVLKERGALKNQPVKRIVFNEITKSAVLKAVSNPRELDQSLIEAYLARRALDYLVGFTLSPVLWRKLPGSRSAGRVQSVALRLICDREGEIELFKPQEYWSINAQCMTAHQESFGAKLSILNHKKVEKFTLTNQTQATSAVAALEAHKPYHVTGVEKKKVQRHPAPPFTTSTLQQEASRKLGFGASRTMQLAQRLYEGIELNGEVTGLITYMRTDSVNISADAVSACRETILGQFGKDYLPDGPRAYKTKSKNAQEAHEGIRPTLLSRLPEHLEGKLEKDQWRLYQLIWRRMMASQMTSAAFDQVSADITSPDQSLGLRAVGTTRVFDGFLKLYEEGQDDAEEDEDNRKLPPLAVGDVLTLVKVDPNQHFTQPPPRYSEASLVKKLEELGIGRPSTYATILHVLQDRQYVHLDKKTFIPDERGRLVTTFLTNFFGQYVEFSFTADLEDQLDDISSGNRQWKNVLEVFWKGFHEATEGASKLKISDVIDVLNEQLGSHFFPAGENGEPSRKCPKCEDGQLSLKLGKFGAFVGCSNYPTCTHTHRLVDTKEFGEGESSIPEGDYPRSLGKDPASNSEISVRSGPYGYYLQWGEMGEDKTKPKRVPVPKTLNPATLTFEEALVLGNLPRLLGKNPDTGEDITAGIGRFGPYIKHQSTFTSLKKEDDVLTVSLGRALELLLEAANKPKTARSFGAKKKTAPKTTSKSPPKKKSSS